MTLPNFLIIGAAKSGTTSLFYYLREHPQIFMCPRKETNFFAYENRTPESVWWGTPPSMILESITDLSAYHQQFKDSQHEIAVGEASPLYLYSPRAPARIRQHIPDVKLIAILRNPVDRAFSHFCHLHRDDREPESSFAAALDDESRRMSAGWIWDYNYVDLGHYFHQLRRYYDLFERSQISIFLYEDLKTNAAGLLMEIFQFLGVDDRFRPNTTIRHNISGIPRSKWLQRFLSNPNFIKSLSRILLPSRWRQHVAAQLWKRNLTKPQLQSHEKRRLQMVFEDDIIKLQGLIDRDSSSWLE